MEACWKWRRGAPILDSGFYEVQKSTSRVWTREDLGAKVCSVTIVQSGEEEVVYEAGAEDEEEQALGLEGMEGPPEETMRSRRRS